MSKNHVDIDPEQIEPQTILELSGSLTGLRLLEVGCGDGRLTWRYAQTAGEVIAIDPNPDRIEHAQQKAPASLVNKVCFQTADILTFTDHTLFDIALLSWSLWWIPAESMVDALKNIHKLLKPNGRLIDLHPADTILPIYVQNGSTAEAVGTIDVAAKHVKYHLADAAIKQVVTERLFTLEQHKKVDFIIYFDSVNACQTYLAEEWSDAKVASETWQKLGELMRQGETAKKIYFTERIQFFSLTKM